jgi:hypothetical protein
VVRQFTRVDVLGLRDELDQRFLLCLEEWYADIALSRTVTNFSGDSTAKVVKLGRVKFCAASLRSAAKNNKYEEIGTGWWSLEA